VAIRITDPHIDSDPDAYYDIVRKTCLGGGMHCPSTSSFKLVKPLLEVAPRPLWAVCYLFTVSNSGLLFLHVAESDFSDIQFQSFHVQPKRERIFLL